MEATVQRHSAFITGGGGGIGTAIAEALGRAGFEVAISGRRRDHLEAAAGSIGGDVEIVAMDAADEEQVAAALGSRRVDVLVNTAGAAFAAPLRRTGLDEWDRLFRVNATTAFLCSKAVLEQMTSRGWGRIVTVASTAGLVGAAYVSAYTASKHAVVGFTRAVAQEIAGTGVTINAVCPSFVDTPMTDETVANIVATTGRTADEARRALVAQVPLGRLIAPVEVAAAVSYLTSDAAAAISGECMVLDGGGVVH